jgi:hypothetical protein
MIQKDYFGGAMYVRKREFSRAVRKLPDYMT